MAQKLFLLFSVIIVSYQLFDIPDKNKETFPPEFVISHLKDSTISGKVVGITDGDTFKLLTLDSTLLKIRVANIDCPERKQPFSAKAKTFTSQAIFGKTVKLIVFNKDRYGRYIANVLYDGKNLSEELLRYGFAWHYIKYSNDSSLQEIEDLARKQKVGLWAEKYSIPPWDWRKGIRK